MRRVGPIIVCMLAACGSALDRAADGDSATDSALPDVPLDTADGVETADTVDDTGDTAPTDATDTALPDGPDTSDTTDPIDTADTADTAPGDGEVTGPWRSVLYPDDWQPGVGVGDARLDDFSYAGYHLGVAEPGTGLGRGGRESLPRFVVTDYGATPADPDQPAAAADASAAFQAAIDAAAAAGGGVVWVPAGLYRLDLWLEIRASRVVLAGEGASLSRLWFTREAAFDQRAHLEVAGAEVVLAEVPLTTDGARFDTWIEVADTDPFELGEDVVLGETPSAEQLAAWGMTTLWAELEGHWQPHYRRTVVGVDRQRHRVALDVPLRGPLAVSRGATLRKVGGLVREVGIEDLGVADAIAWRDAWGGQGIAAIGLTAVADAWIRGVSSFPSPSAPTFGMGAGAELQSNGIRVVDAKRVTIADCHLGPAQNRGGFGNGYGFAVRRSSEVLTRDSSGRGARNNVVSGPDFGTSGCVWLRVTSSDGAEVPLGPDSDDAMATRGEMHSLARANLVDSCQFDDGFDLKNRGPHELGPGHSATGVVFWNYRGGQIISLQLGLGYVIGTAPRTIVSTATNLSGGADTAPEDWVEGDERGPDLVPSSLYEDQLARRR